MTTGLNNLLLQAMIKIGRSKKPKVKAFAKHLEQIYTAKKIGVSTPREIYKKMLTPLKASLYV